MSEFSFIYRSIYIYRIILNILYWGKYKNRFDIILGFLSPKNDKKVMELCFGDIYIAEWCKINSIEWIGVDINPNFVSFAKKKKYNCSIKDLSKFPILPKSNTTLIIGSLYHFNLQLDDFIDYVMNYTNRLLISEPIYNLSNQNSILGYIARRSTKVSKEKHSFRYNLKTIREKIKKINEGKYRCIELLKNDREIIIEIKKRVLHDI